MAFLSGIILTVIVLGPLLWWHAHEHHHWKRRAYHAEQRLDDFLVEYHGDDSDYDLVKL